MIQNFIQEDIMRTIADFTGYEQKPASTILFERYGRLVAIQLADSEL